MGRAHSYPDIGSPDRAVREGHVRPGPDRNRKDGLLRVDNPRQDRCAAEGPPVDNTRPHKRAGCPGLRGDVQTRQVHRARLRPDIRRGQHRGSDQEAEDRRRYHSGYAWARQRHDVPQRAEPQRHKGRGAGRGRPHAGHGVHRRHRGHTAHDALKQADPADVRHDAGRRKTAFLRLHEGSEGDQRIQGRGGPGPHEAVLYFRRKKEQVMGPQQDTGYRPAEGDHILPDKKDGRHADRASRSVQVCRRGYPRRHAPVQEREGSQGLQGGKGADTRCHRCRRKGTRCG